MPRKVRELIRDLVRAGFVLAKGKGKGKGSHRKFKHPVGPFLTLSGSSGDDAKPYQERDVARVIKESE